MPSVHPIQLLIGVYSLWFLWLFLAKQLCFQQTQIRGSAVTAASGFLHKTCWNWNSPHKHLFKYRVQLLFALSANLSVETWQISYFLWVIDPNYHMWVRSCTWLRWLLHKRRSRVTWLCVNPPCLGASCSCRGDISPLTRLLLSASACVCVRLCWGRCCHLLVQKCTEVNHI